MGVATGCGCKRYIDFLILLIPTPLVYICSFYSSIPTFCSFFKCFIIIYNFCIQLHTAATSHNSHKNSSLLLYVIIIYKSMRTK